METASFVVAVISLLVAIATFVFVGPELKKLRYVLAALFLMLTVVCIVVGVVYDWASRKPTPSVPATSTPTPTPFPEGGESIFVLIGGRGHEGFQVDRLARAICIDDRHEASEGEHFIALYPMEEMERFLGIEAQIRFSSVSGWWTSLGLSTVWGDIETGTKLGFYINGPPESPNVKEGQVSVVMIQLDEGDEEVTEVLPVRSDFSKPHALRIEKDGDSVDFYFDDTLVTRRTLPSTEEYGVYAQLEGNAGNDSDLAGCWEEVEVIWGEPFPPTPTPTPTPPPGRGAISWQWCLPGGLESCQCDWGHTIEESRTEEIADSWYLRNTGTGTLTIYSIEFFCEGDCLDGLISYGKENTRDDATVRIPPQSEGGITLVYDPEKDPQRGTEHGYKIVIYSDAENCPELTIPVPIRYK